MGPAADGRYVRTGRRGDRRQRETQFVETLTRGWHLATVLRV
jgi:hypothetical protein